jgi:hypothetical protein
MASCHGSLWLSDFGGAIMCSAACHGVWMRPPVGTLIGLSNRASHAMIRPSAAQAAFPFRQGDPRNPEAQLARR